jgi:hypothetical protein
VDNCVKREASEAERAREAGCRKSLLLFVVCQGCQGEGLEAMGDLDKKGAGRKKEQEASSGRQMSKQWKAGRVWQRVRKRMSSDSGGGTRSQKLARR